MWYEKVHGTVNINPLRDTGVRGSNGSKKVTKLTVSTVSSLVIMIK